MADTLPDDFQKNVFYHGTTLEAAESIAQYGFQVWREDDDGERYPSGGNLGNGIYVSTDWRTALWFGPTLLQVGLRPGTKLLNAALPPDGKLLDSLKREFGREILTKPAWKVLPQNKKLKLRELIALFRHHYQQTWEKDWTQDREGFERWPRQRELHEQLLHHFRSMLIRYGFHGYGNPLDDNGIVVFAGDRLVLRKVVGEFESASWWQSIFSDVSRFRDVRDLRDYFRRNGTQRAKALAAVCENVKH